MAKRKEIILQEVLNSQEAWDSAMNQGKLYVVDAHQKWCGPCTAITGMLKRIKNELGDDLLKFATAEVDSVDSLDRYRGKCEPNFLFFASGELVGAVRGCNAPLIQQTIHSTLEMEHKVLNGEAERKVIRDVQTSPEQEQAEEPEAEDEKAADEGVVPKQVTVALIKPDVVQNGQVDEILQKISEAGIEVLADEERMLNEEEAREFYKHKSNEEFFEDLIKYVTSGPCRVLVLTKGETGKGIVSLWRDIIGPFDAAVAKEENERSLRAIYGVNATCNALHGSSSEEDAARELAFLFPDFEPPTFKSDRPFSSRVTSARSKPDSSGRVQKTLAIVRPDALRKHKDAIMKKIEESGFKIAMQKEMTLTTEQAEDFYASHKDEEYFDPLVKQMTCGPVLALCLVRDDAIDQWRSMLGPKVVSEAVEQEPESLRAQFSVEEAEVNMLHGSDSPETAEKELSKFFAVEQTLAVIKPDAMSEKDKIISKLQEAGFMISCQKDSTLTRDLAEQIYKSKEGADYYETLIDHMTSGHTLALVLSAEDAVDKLRTIMGPTDPDKAKEEQPDSLRAVFAKSIIENAIHSPSNKQSADEEIHALFGDVTFHWDGTFIPHMHDGADEGAASTPAPEGEAADDAAKENEEAADETSTEAKPADGEEAGETEATDAEPKTDEAEPAATEPETAATAAEQTTEAEQDQPENPVEAVASEAEPAASEAEPAASEAEPETNEAEPETNEAEPETNDAEPAANDAEPAANDAEPATNDAEPAANDAKPAVNEAEPDAAGEELAPSVERGHSRSSSSSSDSD